MVPPRLLNALPAFSTGDSAQAANKSSVNNAAMFLCKVSPNQTVFEPACR